MEIKVKSWKNTYLIIFAALHVLFLCACSTQGERAQKEPQNIHFVGDSFTVYHKADLPEMFSRLAETGGH
jgi:hypothetical protein